MPQIKRFRGLNNVSDPLRLGLGWLAQADNVNITDTGAVVKRSGYVLSSLGNFSAAFSTKDFQRMYVVKDGVLQTFEGVALVTLTSTATMYWAEVNNQVFFNNGTDSGVILPDHTVLMWHWPEPPPATENSYFTYLLPDGRMTGTGAFAGSGGTAGLTAVEFKRQDQTTVFTNDQYGDLVNQFLDPLPLGSAQVQHWKGRMYAAQYLPESDMTVVWYSQPLGFHLFNLNSDFFTVQGQVLMLAEHKDALIVGTAQKVFAYTGTELQTLATYGVIPGQHAALDDDTLYFWTTRGLCTALPFSNLTERQVSVAPGVQAGGTVVLKGGMKRYLVALHAGGNAFNPYL